MMLSTSLLALFGILSVLSSPAMTDRQSEDVYGYPLTQFVATTPTKPPLPDQKVLENGYHIIQSFNNCGPASLSMTLSYFGINKSQEELGQKLRPYQSAIGDNDDKSVTLDELAQEAEANGLIAYHRPNGTIPMLREFIAAGIPVITRTWLESNEDIGHYRVVKGYNNTDKTLVQDDSYQGKSLVYSYDDFTSIWGKFNYEYLVIVPKEKKQLAESILGNNLNETYAWQQARDNSSNELKENPDDAYSRFNLAVAYYHLGDYKKTIEEYEKAEPSLPSRMLWYQLEPVDAYFKTGNYDKVFAIADSILNNQNRAYSELYLLRGKIYEKQGNKEAAKAEYENAVYYNNKLESAQQAFSSISL